MSLFGKPTDLNRQFIARPDAAKEDILYKWPDMTIRKFTQVTVQPDETAIFFKEGKVAGTLPQGRSTLDGALFPFLGDIVDWASGGNMYRAELYFIGTREFVSLPFGGPIDNIEDPETGLAVGLRVFGEYAMSVSDPSAMILKLVGTRQASNELITDWAREQILKAYQTFAYNVYKQHSLKKALMLRVYYSDYGQTLLWLLTPFRSLLRKATMGV